ncbi:acyltransferase [Rhodococcus sp. BP-316]|uniref:acyltransferase n=1 Tax=Rhodococcus sp. BP-316 TaxID=2739445 RepID=UPI001C9B36FA|nr:acyltransferase [Rhodococcus sp. BP-316]
MIRTFSRLWPGLYRDIVLNQIIASPFVPVRLRRAFLNAYGLSVGRSRVAPHVWIGSTRLSIGDNSFVNYGTMFNTSEQISIGNFVDVGMRCLFITSSHELGPPSHRAAGHVRMPIVVGDGTWIGAGVTILPGVVIGAGCVVAAGSVVTQSIRANTLVGGVPARAIRDLSNGTECASDR